MTSMEALLLEQSLEWVRSVGNSTLELFNNPDLVIDSKLDGSPVTEADRRAEMQLRELIVESHPADAIEGEESDDRAGTSGRRWVIDPIDGTKAFAHGVATFSNLLYAEDADGPLLGIINLPALGETIYAARGEGCFFNGSRCHVSDVQEPGESYLSCTGFHMWSPERFRRVTEAGYRLRTWGDAYGYALVASGRIEAMMDPILARWDIMAPALIVSEAGGVITSMDGGDALTADDAGFYSAIASNGRSHQSLVEVLNT